MTLLGASSKLVIRTVLTNSLTNRSELVTVDQLSYHGAARYFCAPLSAPARYQGPMQAARPPSSASPVSRQLVLLESSAERRGRWELVPNMLLNFLHDTKLCGTVDGAVVGDP
jgi:hypothetical protein